MCICHVIIPGVSEKPPSCLSGSLLLSSEVIYSRMKMFTIVVVFKKRRGMLISCHMM